MSEALEKAPPKAYLEAMAALLKWLQNNNDLLTSEKLEVRELPVMEKQLRQFKVGLNEIYYILQTNNSPIVQVSEDQIMFYSYFLSNH